MTSGHIKAKLIPWDDPRFLQAFERAREQAIEEGLTINGPKTAARVEDLLRSNGYPEASVDVERTVEEALEHAAHWRVTRDGAGGGTPDRRG